MYTVYTIYHYLPIWLYTRRTMTILLLLLFLGVVANVATSAVTHEAPPTQRPATNDIGRTGPSGRYVGTRPPPQQQQQQRHCGRTDTPAAATASPHRHVALRSAHTTSPSSSSASVCVWESVSVSNQPPLWAARSSHTPLQYAVRRLLCSAVRRYNASSPPSPSPLVCPLSRYYSPAVRFLLRLHAGNTKRYIIFASVVVYYTKMIIV